MIDDMVLRIGGNIYIVVVVGCIDFGVDNYDFLVNIDDGFCKIIVISGIINIVGSSIVFFVASVWG
jgi:hypothetical protein